MSDITRRSLVVNLTDQEITDCSKELAKITTLQAQIEEEKKTATSSFKEKLDRCISESRSLARKCSTRQDFREVDCEWRPNYDTRIKRLIRLDTLEEIEVRKLTNDELQEELPLEPGIPAVCPKCDGDGIYFDNSPDSEEYERYCDCPAGKALEAKETAAATPGTNKEESTPAESTPAESGPVESGPVSLCATCVAECSYEDPDYGMLNSTDTCVNYSLTPGAAEIKRRDDLCDDGWRECEHTFKCFGPANDGVDLCFKTLNEAKELEEEKPAVFTVDDLMAWGYSRNEAKILSAGFRLVKYDRENKTLHTSCTDPRAGWIAGDTHPTYAEAERELKRILADEQIIQINMNNINVEGGTWSEGCWSKLASKGFAFYRAEGIISGHGTPKIKTPNSGGSWATWKKFKTAEECQAAWDELLTTDPKALADSTEPVTADKPVGPYF